MIVLAERKRKLQVGHGDGVSAQPWRPKRARSIHLDADLLDDFSVLVEIALDERGECPGRVVIASRPPAWFNFALRRGRRGLPSLRRETRKDWLRCAGRCEQAEPDRDLIARIELGDRRADRETRASGVVR